MIFYYYLRRKKCILRGLNLRDYNELIKILAIFFLNIVFIKKTTVLFLFCTVLFFIKPHYNQIAGLIQFRVGISEIFTQTTLLMWVYVRAGSDMYARYSQHTGVRNKGRQNQLTVFILSIAQYFLYCFSANLNYISKVLQFLSFYHI